MRLLYAALLLAAVGTGMLSRMPGTDPSRTELLAGWAVLAIAAALAIVSEVRYRREDR